MQTLHTSTRAIEHTSLQSIVTTRDAASTSRPSLLRNATQNPHRHPPSVAASKFRPVARQAASSHWVCAGCSSRFLAGDQKLRGPKQAAVERLGSARKRTRTVTAQWFHFKSTKSLNVPVREESPGIDEYLQDTERIVHIAFPDDKRLRYLGDGLWRATLRPVNFFTISATPVTDVRTWYEAGALQISSNRVVLDLAGLPPQFHGIDLRLNLRGSLTRTVNPAPGATNCAMNGSVDLGVGVDLPLPLSLIPAPAVNGVGTAILEGILIAMESALRRGLVDDYRNWCLQKRSRMGETRQEQGVKAR